MGRPPQPVSASHCASTVCDRTHAARSAAPSAALGLQGSHMAPRRAGRRVSGSRRPAPNPSPRPRADYALNWVRRAPLARPGLQAPRRLRDRDRPTHSSAIRGRRRRRGPGARLAGDRAGRRGGGAGRRRRGGAGGGRGMAAEEGGRRRGRVVGAAPPPPAPRRRTCRSAVLNNTGEGLTSPPCRGFQYRGCGTCGPPPASAPRGWVLVVRAAA